jgi:predicted GH43/DUF377 family glycosyl hydrolase
MSTALTPSTVPTNGLARLTGIDLHPDVSRVVARLFVPGLEAVGPTGSRAGSVLDRILQIDEALIGPTLDELHQRFAGRHRDLDAVFEANAEKVVTVIDPAIHLSPARRKLIGAYFTHEYSIEGASLSNPSIVLHPQDNHGPDARFIMSVRGIGEGHKSSIGFRTGTVSAAGDVVIDEPSRFAQTATGTAGRHFRSVFHAKLDLLGDDFEHVHQLLALLPAEFGEVELNEAIDKINSDRSLHGVSPSMVNHVVSLSHWSYQVKFPPETDLSERILWPQAPPEYHGMEDARFVRFVNDDGGVMYYGTYTAFDRGNISLQLLETEDFLSFSSSPMAGAAAAGKGLALFPRKVRGRYMALTRADRETNGVASSDDIRHWSAFEMLQVPQEHWEVLQLGNCGSPIETEYGWLVLTHGVGPMRTYALGALLLDLEQPSQVIARSVEPILFPDVMHRDGYVPNVVYSCGGLAHGDHLVLPFGIADQRISIATFSISALINSMAETGPTADG